MWAEGLRWAWKYYNDIGTLGEPAAARSLQINRQGQVRCLYSEQIDLGALGGLTIRRASQVEPDAKGQWLADLAPVGGPCLGPLTDARRRWPLRKSGCRLTGWLVHRPLIAAGGPMIVKLVLSERDGQRCWQHFAFYQEEGRQNASRRSLWMTYIGTDAGRLKALTAKRAGAALPSAEICQRGSAHNAESLTCIEHFATQTVPLYGCIDALTSYNRELPR